jgi:UDP-N-acetylglucosamine 2-epimerase
MTTRMTLLSCRGDERPADWREVATPHADGGRIVHVGGECDDAPRIAAAAIAIDTAGVFEQLVVDAAPESACAPVLAELGAGVAVRRLVARPADALGAFEAELSASSCVAVVVYADHDVALVAALAAARRGVAVVRVGGAVAASGPGRAIARLADLHLMFGEPDAEAMRARRPHGRVRVIGNPLVDVVRRCARDAGERAERRRYGVSPRGYVLAQLTGVPEPRAVAALARLAERTPLLVDASGGWAGIALPPRARRVGAHGVVARLSLARTAGAIVTDSPRAQEEAAAIGVRCHSFGAAAAAAGGATIRRTSPGELGGVLPRGNAPTPCAVPYWDGHAGARLAAALGVSYARLRLG